MASVIQWGDVPTWVAGVGTVGTLAWAIGLGRSERQQRRRDAERVQALAVSAWIEQRSAAAGAKAIRGDDHVPLTVGPEAARPRPSAVISNASRSPVYDVEATLVHPRQAGEYITHGYEVLPPGQQAFFVPGQFSDVASVLRVRLAFLDEGGVRWVRDHEGRLTKQRDPR